MNTWKEFWNTEHRIYVSRRHVEAYYATLTRDILHLLPAKRPLRFLDWGCGEAAAAPAIAASGVSVLLYDPVPRAHQKLVAAFRDAHSIRVLEEQEYQALAPGSVDVVLIHSVLQYLTKEEFEALIEWLRTRLARDGVLYLGDVVPPSVSMLSDVRALLSAAWQHGFVFAAFFGMAMTFFSNYRVVRKQNGFSTYTESELIDLLSAHGFLAKRMKENIGLSANRMSFEVKVR